MRTTLLTLAAVVALSATTQAGIFYEYDANNPGANPGSTWASTTTNQDRNWTVGSGITYVTTDPSPASNIDAAYDFGGTGSGMTTGAFNNSGGASFSADSTWEIWFKIDALPGSNEQTLIETGGGGTGGHVYLQNSAVHFFAGATGSQPDVSAALTSAMLGDFIQVVVTLDQTNDMTSIYLNGSTSPADSGSHQPPYGTNDASLGNTENASKGSGGSFGGQIAIVRIYDEVLNGQGVADSYNTVIPEPATIALLGLGGAVMLSGRRRRV